MNSIDQALPEINSSCPWAHDRRAALLLDWAGKKKAHQAAQVLGTEYEVFASGWDLTAAAARIDGHEEDLADAFVMMMRAAARHRRYEVLGLLDELLAETETVNELTDAVVRLEPPAGPGVAE